MDTFPMRCQIVEGNPYDGPPRSEDGSPYIGEFGVVDMVDGKEVVTLDNGTVVDGSQCWWAPVAPKVDEEDLD